MPAPPRATSSAAAFRTSRARPSAAVCAAERFALALRRMETFAQSPDGRLRLGRLTLRALVGGGVLGGGSLRAPDRGRRPRAPPPPRRAGPVPHRAPAAAAPPRRGRPPGGRGRFRRAAQGGDAHVVLRDQRALRSDVDVEGIEFGAGTDDVAGRLRPRHPERLRGPPAISSISARTSSIMPCETVVSSMPASSAFSPSSASRWPVSWYRPRKRSCTRSSPYATVRASSTPSERWRSSSTAMRVRRFSAWSCRTRRSV